MFGCAGVQETFYYYFKEGSCEQREEILMGVRDQGCE